MRDTSPTPGTSVASKSAADHIDSHLWLEEVDSAAALDWVVARSDQTLSLLGEGARPQQLHDGALAILDADDRIPWPVLRGDWAYNVWRDADHPRGLWRRIPRAEVETWTPDSRDADWETLLDVDALAEAEEINWVYSGTVVRRTEDDRALIRLSRGGADAVELREYDLVARKLYDGPGAFRLRESKCSATWVDGDTLLLASALDEGPGGNSDTTGSDTTESGYARTVRLWRRGTDAESAPILFAGDHYDVAVGAGRDPETGRILFSRALDFHNSETWYLSPTAAAATVNAAHGTADSTAGEPTIRPTRVPAPTDCSLMSAGDWLAAIPRKEMRATTHDGERTLPGGSVIVYDWAAIEASPDALPVGTVLFEPTPSTAVDDLTWGRGRLILTILDDVATRLESWTIPDRGDGWRRVPVRGLPEHVSIDVIACDRLSGAGPSSDTALLSVTGPVTPPSLVRLDPEGDVRTLAASPDRFDASDIVVEQHMATSDDGTLVPYSLMRPAGEVTPGPTILYGYGGFEIAMRPSYAGLRGKLWVDRGGTYVVAGIRGGGEYGPGWHDAALREKRPRAYEDFAAVARDLVTRGYCRTDQLGATGGSNGGLLMGVMLTRYPELFAALAIAVPLLDMRRYHLLLAGASWVAEYGDPDSDDWDAFLGAYSPYQHVVSSEERRYPPVLMTTSTRDDRVHPGHARKMTAALEAGGHDVSYYENIEGGHAGAADNSQEARKAMLTYEFFWRRLGDADRDLTGS